MIGEGFVDEDIQTDRQTDTQSERDVQVDGEI